MSVRERLVWARAFLYLGRTQDAYNQIQLALRVLDGDDR